MFDKTPASLTSSRKIVFCDCALEDAGLYQPVNKLEAVTQSELPLPCKESENGRFLSLIPGLDVTAEYLGPADLVRGLKNVRLHMRWIHLHFCRGRIIKPNFTKCH